MTLSRGRLFVLFTLSGFSGLIYESIWTHYLKLFLGHAAYAQTLVLAIFMGGMALGAWASARHGHRWRGLLRAYALVEAVTGLLALAFHGVFVAATEAFFQDLGPALPSPLAVDLAKWGLAVALILPQSVLLGMTFPLMSGGLLRHFPERGGASLASLYFVNSLGGAMGVLASGFLLVGWLGLPGTVALAGLINLALAFLVWRMEPPARRPPLPERPPGPSGRPGILAWMLGAALLTGLSSFVYEVGWIRMLSLVLGSSTHAFELMLSAFILGLALGGLWIRGRIDALPSPRTTLGWIQVVMGLLALATLPLYGYTFDLLEWLLGMLPKTPAGYLGYNLAGHGIASLIMLPAAFCAGMTLPLITHILLRDAVGERGIGLVYAANTLGAIAGVLLAVHVGLPWLGLKGMLIAAGGVDILLGLALLWRWPGLLTSGRLRAAALGSAALVSLFALAGLDQRKMAAGAYRTGKALAADTEVAYYRDGKTASVAVTRSPELLALRTNGKADASILTVPGRYALDEVTMVTAGALPLLLRPDARLAANIGLGSGLTTHALLASPAVTRVDTVEIEPAMREGAALFAPRNARAFGDPRSQLHYEDAKSFFSSRNQRYDVVVSEPSNPWVSGVAGLFSAEFYRLIRRHLTPDGLFVQWLQLYEIDLARVVSVLKALEAQFDDYAVYASNFGDVLIVATPHGRVPPLPAAFPDQPALLAELARLDILTPQDLGLRRLGGKRLFSPWLARQAVPANSDYAPYLDQHANRDRFLQRNAFELANLALFQLPLTEILEQPSPWPDTRVTAAPHWRRPHPAFEAALVRDLLAGRAPLRPARLPASVWQAALAKANGIVDECRFLPGGDPLRAALNFAFDVVPYLRPAENLALRDHLDRLPCFAGLEGPRGHWRDFVHALGRRDVEGLTRAGEALRQAGLLDTRGRRMLVLATSLLGYAAQGRAERAREWWLAEAPALFGEATKAPLSFQILAALSLPPERGQESADSPYLSIR